MPASTGAIRSPKCCTPFVISDAKAIIVEAGCVHQIRDHIEELQAEGRAIIGFGEGHGLTLDYETLLRGAQRPVCAELSDEDWAMIGYTSGTTGMPKGAILTQRNVRESVIHNTLANEYTFNDVRLYVTNPAGINIFQMCFNIATGFTTVIDDFETTRFLELTEEHKVTTVTLVPTMLSRIVEQVRTGHYDVSSLRQVCYGTMPSTPALIRSAYDTLGCTFMQRYGVSESSGAVAALRDQDHRRAIAGEPELLTSVGKPLFHADISIRDDDGKPLPAGEIGTVWIKSDTIMAGYLQPAGGDRRRASPAMAADWRLRPQGRPRLYFPRRPQEQHDHFRRVQRLSGRRGKCAGGTPGRAGGRRHRHAASGMG